METFYDSIVYTCDVFSADELGQGDRKKEAPIGV